MPVRKDGSAAKPSRRSDEYAFQPHPPPYCLTIQPHPPPYCLTIQPHPPLTRSPFPDLGEGFKLNRSLGLQIKVLFKTKQTLKTKNPYQNKTIKSKKQILSKTNPKKTRIKP